MSATPKRDPSRRCGLFVAASDRAQPRRHCGASFLDGIKTLDRRVPAVGDVNGRDDRLRVRKQDPHFRELYEKSYERLSNVLKESRGEREVTPHVDRPLPDFDRAVRHSDPETDAAIQRKIDDLRTRRKDFLFGVRVELAGDPMLYKLFREKICASHGDRYLAGLDPDASLG